MKIISFICVFFIAFVFINAAFIESNLDSNKYAKYKQMYAKDISLWEKPEIEDSIKQEWKEFAPLPKIAPSPQSNPFSQAKADLGKILFNDRALSKSGQISCASCHNENLAFGDGLKKSIGHNRQEGRRNAPNIEMSGFFDLLFWDGRADSLESQATFPMQDSKEMANTLENVVKAVSENPSYYARFIESFGTAIQIKKWQEKYPILFKIDSIKIPVPNIESRLYPKDSKSNIESNLAGLTPNQKQNMREQVKALFGDKDFHKKIDSMESKNATFNFTQSEIKEAKKLINIENISKAIATYERTLVPQNTRFNRFLKGEYNELSDFEAYGLHIFRTKGRCMNCHYGAILSDSKFHNIGLSFYGRKTQDLGRGEITGKSEDMGAFRTPSLVNVSKSAPYFHNGISPNLTGLNHLYDMAFPIPLPQGINIEQGVDKKSINIESVPAKTNLIKQLNLTSDELSALEAFLQSL